MTDSDTTPIATAAPELDDRVELALERLEAFLPVNATCVDYPIACMLSLEQRLVSDGDSVPEAAWPWISAAIDAAEAGGAQISPLLVLSDDEAETVMEILTCWLLEPGHCGGSHIAGRPATEGLLIALDMGVRRVEGINLIAAATQALLAA